MKITFVRHAETTLNNSNKFCGRSDVGITENGMLKCHELINFYPFSNGSDYFNEIYISTLKRTYQTLKSIFPTAHFKIDCRIDEICLGTWEGIEKTSVEQNLRKNFRKGTYTPPCAETHNDVIKRIESFLTDLSTIYPDNAHILVITHAGIIRTLKQIFGIDNDSKSKNLEFFTIEYNNIKSN